MIQKRASLHEKTVQKVASGQLKQIRKPATTPDHTSGQIATVRVNPELISYAKKVVADKSNGYTSWALLSGEEVVIR